jgi:hypothetical protein
MREKIFALVTILLAALDTGLAYAHALELPAKMNYDASLYLLIHRTLYWGFGNIGGPISTLVVVLTLVLAWTVRRQPAVFRLVTAGALCYAAAMIVFLLLVNPMNSALKSLDIDAPPLGWQVLRNQWEYSHLFRFLLQVTGLTALLAAFVVRDRPAPRVVERVSEMRRPAMAG